MRAAACVKWPLTGTRRRGNRFRGDFLLLVMLDRTGDDKDQPARQNKETDE